MTTQEKSIDYKKKALLKAQNAFLQGNKTFSSIKIVAPTFAVLLVALTLFIRSNYKNALLQESPIAAYKNLLPPTKETSAALNGVTNKEVTGSTAERPVQSILSTTDNSPKKMALPTSVGKTPLDQNTQSEGGPAVFLQAQTTSEKMFQQQDMEPILMQLKKEMPAKNNNSQCLQIRKSRNCNVVNAFELAQFLRMNGYSIGGRKIVDTKSEGIDIHESNGCIVLTVGHF
jgi:hypothetical protein